MIIGHAPAGYITSSFLFRKLITGGLSRKAFVMSGVMGALAPDLDMIYFHAVDHRLHHHHTYFTHFPIFWLSLLVVSIVWLSLRQQSKNAALAFVFCLGGFIHLILDSIVGDIWWFAPFVDQPFPCLWYRRYISPGGLILYSIGLFLLSCRFGFGRCFYIVSQVILPDPS